MYSKTRIHYPGAVYHVILRGKGGQDIFFQDSDEHFFCLLLEEGMKRFGFRLYAFCLMPNHVHVAVQVGDISCSRIMRDICFRYTQYINTMHKKTGPLFQPRHKAILIDDKNYLLELVRYIHLNPVRAGMVKKPDLYPWSSHHAHMGQENMAWVSTNWVLSRFSPLINTARERYKNFISEGMREGHRPEFHRGNGVGRILGDESFARSALRRAEETQKRLLSLDETIEQVCKVYSLTPAALAEPGYRLKPGDARAIAALIVHEQDHLSLIDLGKRLNRYPGDLRQSADRMRERVQTDYSLAENLNTVAQQLGLADAFHLPLLSSMERPLSIDQIIEEVCRLYSLRPAVLAEAGRTPDVAEARAMIALMVSEHHHLSLAELGRRLNRHHTAMPHVAVRLLKRMKKNPSLAEKAETVRSQLVRIQAGQAPSVPSITTKLSIDEVIEEVGRLYSLRPVVLAEPGIEPERVEARAVAALIVKDQGHFSVSALGRRLNRTSSTMSGGIKKLLKRMETDPDLAERVDRARQRLKQV